MPPIRKPHGTASQLILMEDVDVIPLLVPNFVDGFGRKEGNPKFNSLFGNLGVFILFEVPAFDVEEVKQNIKDVYKNNDIYVFFSRVLPLYLISLGFCIKRTRLSGSDFPKNRPNMAQPGFPGACPSKTFQQKLLGTGLSMDMLISSWM